MVFHSQNELVKFQDELYKCGYSKWENTNNLFKYDYVFQKLFKDDLGKKYYIDFEFYDYTKTAYPSEGIRVSIGTTFNNDGDEPDKLHNTIWIEADFDSIEQAEQLVETLWKASNSQYYELWSEC